MDQLTTLEDESHVAMSMEAFHCETFEVRMRFDSHEMNIEGFLESLSERGISAEPDADGDRDVSLTFPGGEEGSPYHGHLTVQIWNSGSANAELSYHSGDTEKGAESPLTVDDCAKWFGSFFHEAVTAHLHVDYGFDKTFTAVVTLPFPLVTSEKHLAGAMVSGLALTIPNETKIPIIQRVNDKIYLFLRETIQVDLSKFSFLSELERFSGFVDALIKKTNA